MWWGGEDWGGERRENRRDGGKGVVEAGKGDTRSRFRPLPALVCIAFV